MFFKGRFQIVIAVTEIMLKCHCGSCPLVFLHESYVPRPRTLEDKNHSALLNLTRCVTAKLVAAADAAAKSLQSCLTLCDPIDGSSPGFPVPGILQARTLEWVAIAFSNAWKWEVKVKSLSHVRLFATLWPAAYQAPPSMGSSRHELLSGVPVPSPKLVVRTLVI